MNCRHCSGELEHVFADLATAPPANAYVTKDRLREAEKYYPLRVLVCERCWLVQTEDYAGADELFDEDYAYFSSFSTTWLKHCEDYVAAMVERFSLDGDSTVAEIAANDGYLLQFVQQRGIACYGVEPTASTVAAARAKGIDIIEAFFGDRLARALVQAGRRADLVAANNVLAHVPDINDFAKGISRLLSPAGVATFEFAHLCQLVEKVQFDTIYHEHYSYLALTVVNRIFSANGLQVFDVEELPTHGGSLRVFAQRASSGTQAVSERVADLLGAELRAGVETLHYYQGFQRQANRIKDDFVSYLVDSKRQGVKVAAYGAAAKGNTLLNFAGVRGDLIAFVVDRNPAKQGKFLPGSRIPIVDEAWLRKARPDRVVLFPWNLRDEVMQQLQYVTDWGARFVTAVPELEIWGHNT